MLAEKLSDETKAKLKSSRKMSNFAQGVFVCLSLSGADDDFISRQYILCPLPGEVQQSRGQVLSKVGFFSLKRLTYFKVGKHG